MSDYYCPEHKYNPAPNSGFAFCPECEAGSSGGELSGACNDQGDGRRDGCPNSPPTSSPFHPPSC